MDEQAQLTGPLGGVAQVARRRLQAAARRSLEWSRPVAAKSLRTGR